MRIIDVHTHVWPDALAPHAVSAVGSQGHIAAHYDGTVAGLTSAMDRAGVDVSVVLPVATKAGQVLTINDYAASLRTNPRLVPFGAMHPDLEEPAAEVARMRSIGLTGFKMHPEYQAFDPLDAKLEPIYAAAVEHGMTVFFHAGGDVAFDTVRGTPDVFVELLDSWPELHVVLAHMRGFRQWHAVTGRLAGHDVYFDTGYTLGHLPDDEFVALVRAHGPERVLFGSDGPWTDAGREIDDDHYGTTLFAAPSLDELPPQARSLLSLRPDLAFDDHVAIGTAALRVLIERFVEAGASKFVVVAMADDIHSWLERIRVEAVELVEQCV
jgi:predicted TIM-barrel fold metal-dependent hydrolase